MLSMTFALAPLVVHAYCYGSYVHLCAMVAYRFEYLSNVDDGIMRLKYAFLLKLLGYSVLLMTATTNTYQRLNNMAEWDFGFVVNSTMNSSTSEMNPTVS